MVTLDQSTWNLLFSWITGRQCFIPEGCLAPVAGVFVYLTLLIIVVLVVWKRRAIVERVSGF